MENFDKYPEDSLIPRPPRKSKEWRSVLCFVLACLSFQFCYPKEESECRADIFIETFWKRYEKALLI